MGAHSPKRCTGTIALTRSPTRCARCNAAAHGVPLSGSCVSRSTSQKTGRGTDVRNGLGRRNERKGGGHHRVSRADAERPERELERVGPRRDADRMGRLRSRRASQRSNASTARAENEPGLPRQASRSRRVRRRRPRPPGRPGRRAEPALPLAVKQRRQAPSARGPGRRSRGRASRTPRPPSTGRRPRPRDRR